MIELDWSIARGLQGDRLAEMAHEKHRRAALRAVQHGDGLVEAQRGQRTAHRLAGLERIHRQGFLAADDFGHG
jgi:hypothetical protein